MGVRKRLFFTVVCLTPAGCNSAFPTGYPAIGPTGSMLPCRGTASAATLGPEAANE